MPGNFAASIPGILYILLFIGLELRFRGSRPIPLESRLLSWLFCLGFYQFRYMSFFFLFSTVPLALHVDRLLPGRLNDLEIRKSMLAPGIIGVCVLPLIFVKMEPAWVFRTCSRSRMRFISKHISRVLGF